jgi:hypothetical protein
LAITELGAFFDGVHARADHLVYVRLVAANQSGEGGVGRDSGAFAGRERGPGRGSAR